MKYTELTFTELVNKIGNSRFFDLPKMLKEAFTRLANTPSYEPPYKVYTALLTQSGTNAPVATVLENTLGDTPTFSYISVGQYSINLANSFVENKTFAIIKGANDGDTSSASYNSEIYRANSNTMSLVTNLSSLGSYVDDALNNTSVEIRVYN